jgi:hypothetical protein
MGQVFNALAVNDSSSSAITVGSLNDVQSIFADIPDAPGTTGLDIEVFAALV